MKTDEIIKSLRKCQEIEAVYPSSACGKLADLLEKHLELLQELYLVLGHHMDDGVPAKVLDQVLAAAQGETLPHETLLPYLPDDVDTQDYTQRLKEQNDALKQLSIKDTDELIRRGKLLEKQQAYIDKLEDRLEISHYYLMGAGDDSKLERVKNDGLLKIGEYDGISCRDDTIKLCRQNAENLRSRCEKQQAAMREAIRTMVAVLGSDMAQREEDEGNKSEILDRVRQEIIQLSAVMGDG